MRTEECLKVLAEQRTDEVVIAAMSSAVIWPRFSQHARDLIYVPSAMGGAPALGLGLALARPELRVIVVNGDGAMLMSLGCLVTIGDEAPTNLALLVFDNGVYAVTGGQALPGHGKADFAAMADAAGWAKVHRARTPEEWAPAAEALVSAPGPVFCQATVEAEPMRMVFPPMPVQERLARLQAALGE